MIASMELMRTLLFLMLVVNSFQATLSQIPSFEPTAAQAEVHDQNSLSQSDDNPIEKEVVKPGVIGNSVGKVANDKPVDKDTGDNQQPIEATGKRLKNAAVAVKRPRLGTIAESMECGPDVSRICSPSQMVGDLDVLNCLADGDAVNSLSTTCHQFVWEYKVNMTTNPKYDAMARKVCRTVLAGQFPDCANYESGDGKMISCLLDHLNEVQKGGCRIFLDKIGVAVFSDYRLICNFLEDCQADITTHKCGRIGSNSAPEQNGEDVVDGSHSQTAVITCLTERLVQHEQLSPSCMKQVVRLAELQSNDFHLDRNLYYSCRDDREKFCATVTSGEGKVYTCLFQHKFDRIMSSECRKAITLRQKLISQDYKVSYQVSKYCKRELDAHKCKEHVPVGRNDENDMVGISSMLLCLEERKLDGHDISEKCDQSLVDFRKLLMEDYEMSPLIVHRCSHLIAERCGGGVAKQGETIHCLMEAIQAEPGDHQDCDEALMELIKETEVSENYMMDEALAEACDPVLVSACNDYDRSDPIVLSCLLEQVHNNDLMAKGKCRRLVLDIQYFIGRDFMMDPRFNAQCRDDAIELCNDNSLEDAPMGDQDDADGKDVKMPIGIVLSCLHRYMSHHNTEKALSDGCETEVKRVLKYRALDYHLNPDLEEKCRTQLGLFCSTDLPDKGTELVCLQDNYDKLEEGSCKEEIMLLTRMESEDVTDLESVLINACEKMLQEFCKELLNQEDEGQVMECLIRNKNNMDNEKCRAGVEHFQLIEMKDYRFDYMFVKACQKDVSNHCSGSQTKVKVVHCLSKAIRDAVLANQVSTVSEACREQVTVEKLEMHENIKLNPELAEACASDVKQHCADVHEGEARVIECLRKASSLRPKCKKQIFQLQEEEVNLPKLDYKLMRTCKRDLKRHCMNMVKRNDPQLIMECLIQNKDVLEKNCREVMFEREREIFDDIQLNPDLRDACGDELEDYCQEEGAKLKKMEEQGDDPHGIVYACLKKVFTQDKIMSQVCRRHILFVIREEEENIKLDPQLTLHCVTPLQEHCSGNSGNEVECLKKLYYKDKLRDYSKCMVEVAQLLMETRSDIRADVQLAEICWADVSALCRGVPEGRGRKIKCLMEHARVDPGQLDGNCLDQLQLRQQMWAAAVKENPEGFQDVMKILQRADNANYLLSMLGLVMFGVLVFGVCFGRVSKRMAMERKRI